MASDLLRALEALDAAPLWEWDDDAPGLVRRGLASDAAAERLIAVGLAAELMDDEVAHEISEMMSSCVNFLAPRRQDARNPYFAEGEGLR